MANLLDLPNELLTPIIGHLRDRKIHHFDSVATKDLQTMRLVCPTLSKIATPMLFENMVLDLKFWRVGDFDKMVRFAKTHPELADHVHRLQLRVPSIMSSYYTMQNPFRRIPRSPPLAGREDHDTSTAEIGKIGEMTKNSPRKWHLSELSWGHQGEKGWKPSWTIRPTLELLPYLCHVENVISTHYAQYLAETESRSMKNDGINFAEKSKHDLNLALWKGHKQISSHVTGAITSLKFFGVPYVLGNIPLNLQRLSLDLFIIWPFDDHRNLNVEQETIEDWRSTLKGLVQLRSLRLAFADGRNRTEEHTEEHSMFTPDPLYIDDLLINPQNGADQCFFPHLRSLRLVSCALRARALQTIATRHSATLKELELRKVTFDPLYCVKSWSEIGAMCHEALPNLAYLRLAKLITHSMALGIQADAENLPVPVKWNTGLEGATSYEWIKNGRGSGADLEMIGPKCPWTFEGVN